MEGHIPVLTPKEFVMHIPAHRLLASFIFITLANIAFAAEHTKDTLAVIKANVEQDKAVFIDVREDGEWKEGHLQGALHVPLSRLQYGVLPESLAPDLNKEKILYTHCKVGKRALLAADILEKFGYTIRPVKQGYADLLEAGFPKAEQKP
jgi:rhodanese-related sulfurtransferase